VDRKTGLRSVLVLACLLISCSRLSSLTPDMLNDAQNRWNSAKPASYRVVIVMKGDRIQREQFDVTVKAGRVTSIRRNGQELSAPAGQDYSMDGLFRILQQELALAQKPTLLGAPEGYSAYPMASFDGKSGRLIEYKRTVGGTSNTIDIQVLQFEVLSN